MGREPSTANGGRPALRVCTIASAGMLAPVHHHFLVKSGIPMQESMHLEDLADAQVYEFAYIFTPLRLKGATGSPGSPIALR